MIGIYCRGHGHTREKGFCPGCETLGRYAKERLDRCVFGEDKPVCSKCPVHCYKPQMRAEITAVMRYAGPKMIFRRPILALRHMLDGRKPAPVRPRSR